MLREARVQGMRDLMRLSLARSLRTLSEEDRLLAALPVVCGSAMAGQCTLLGLDGERVLHLRVRAAWMGPMESMREVLRHDLQRVSGVMVSSLRLQDAEAVPVPRKPPVRAATAERMTVNRSVGR